MLASSFCAHRLKPALWLIVQITRSSDNLHQGADAGKGAKALVHGELGLLCHLQSSTWQPPHHPTPGMHFVVRNHTSQLNTYFFGLVQVWWTTSHPIWGQNFEMSRVSRITTKQERNSTHAAGTQIRSEVFTIQIQFFNRHHKHVFPTHTLGHNTPSLPLSIIFSNPPFFLTSQKITLCQFFCKTK